MKTRIEAATNGTEIANNIDENDFSKKRALVLRDDERYEVGSAREENLIPGPKQLADAWAEFLGRWPWCWFATLTFRYETHPEKAKKIFLHWINNLNRSIFGCRYTRRSTEGVIWALALEYQRRDVVHFHALIGGIPESVSKAYWAHLWKKMAGHAKLLTYDPTKGARFYVSKGGLIDIGGPLENALALARGNANAKTSSH
jgi:hypothetical protein